MENKLQELTRKLYDEGLEKGRAEAEKVLADARSQAAGIVDEARAQAESILKNARAQAEELQKNTLTELSLAGRQALSTLKERIASLVVARSVEPAVKQANLDPQFVKEVLLAVARNWNGGSGEAVSLSALLPASQREALDKTFEQSAKELLAAGVEVGYSDRVKSGFKVGAKQGGYYISFSDEDFDALLGEYLREKAARILFEKQ